MTTPAHDTSDVVPATYLEKSTSNAYSDEKKEKAAEATITGIDGPTDDLVPTAEDMATLPRIPAGMP
jgi:hypothetical protein